MASKLVDSDNVDKLDKTITSVREVETSVREPETSVRDDKSVFPFLEDRLEDCVLHFGNYMALGELELARTAVRGVMEMDAGTARRLLEQVARHGPDSSWLSSRGSASPAAVRWFSICTMGDLGLPELPALLVDEVEAELLLHECLCTGALTDVTEAVALELRAYLLATLASRASSEKSSLAGDFSLAAVRASDAAASAAAAEGRSASVERGKWTQGLSEAAVGELKTLLFDFPLLGRQLCARLDAEGTESWAGAAAIKRLLVRTTGTLMDSHQDAEAWAYLQYVDFGREAEVRVGADKLFPRLARMSKDRGVHLQIVQSLVRRSNAYPLDLYLRLEAESVAARSREDAHHAFTGSPDAGAGALLNDVFHAAYVAKSFWLEDALSAAAALVAAQDYCGLSALARRLPRLHALFFLMAWAAPDEDLPRRQRLVQELAAPSAADSPVLHARVAALGFLLKTAVWAASRVPAVQAPDVLRQLERCSVVQALRPCFGALAAEEVLAVIGSSPVRKSAPVSHARDMALVRALALVRELVAAQTSPGSDIDAALVRVEDFLTAPQSPDVRRALLEIMLRLLCLSTAHVAPFSGQDLLASQAFANGLLRVLRRNCVAAVDLDELELRAKIASAVVVPEDRGPGWMRFVLSDARSLAVMAIRARRLDLAREAAESLGANIPELDPADLFARIQRMVLEEPVGEDDLSDAVNRALAKVPGAASLCMMLDAAALPQMPAALGRRLLENAAQLVDQLRGADDGMDVRSLQCVETVVRGLDVATRLSVEASPSRFLLEPSRARGSESPDDLRQRLAAEAVFAAVCTDLRHLCQQAALGTAGAAVVNQQLRKLHRRLAAEPGGDARSRYLELFMSYVIQLGGILNPDPTDEPSLLQLLARAPSDVIEELVFDRGDFDRASKVAALRRESIIGIVLAALERSGDAAARTLNLDLVKYLAHHRHDAESGDAVIALAILAAVLHAPMDHVPGPFIQYAQEQMRSASGSLRLWIERVQSGYVDLVRLFRRGARDGALPDDGALPETDLDSEGQAMARALRGDTTFEEHEFYRGVFDGLVKSGRLEEALEVADEHSVHGAPDFLLKKLIERGGSADLWRYAVRLRDVEYACGVVMAKRRQWDAGVASEMLGMCQSRLPATSPRRPEAERRHAEMQLYLDVLAVPRVRWRTWQELEDDVEANVEGVVRALINTFRQWELARRVAEQWAVSGIRREIEEAYLLHLLSRRDTTAVLQALRKLHVGDVVPIVEAVLIDIPSYRTKRFLIQYVSSNFRQSLAADVAERLARKELGIRVAMLLPEELQGVYVSLVDRPDLILESLVMSAQVELVRQLVHEAPALADDQLMARYAQRALVVPPPGEEVGVGPDRWLLTGDEGDDDETRAIQFFAATPNTDLAKDLLALCADSRFAGQYALTLCDGLSQLLVSGPQDGRAQAVALIQEMLTFAKILFARDGGSGDGISLCDTVLSHVDLLRSLTSTVSNLSGFSLDDMRDKAKVIALRTRLVEEDRMQLAIDLSTRCGVSPDQIWVEWVLSMLDLGLYTDAKEKLQFCFLGRGQAGEGTASGLSSARLADVADRSSLLTQVVDRLEVRRAFDASTLRERFLDLRRVAMAGAAAAPTATSGTPKRGTSFASLGGYLVSALGSPRSPAGAAAVVAAPTVVRDMFDPGFQFMQCVMFLNKYGSVRMLLQFWMRHGLYEDVASYLVKHTAKTVDIFVEDVLVAALARGGLDALLAQLRRHDSELQLIRPHLMAACKYLSGKKAYRVLLPVQMFMCDWARAGVTCVKLYIAAESVEVRLAYLEAAKEHFERALDERLDGGEGEDGAVFLSEATLRQHLAAVVLSCDIVRALRDSAAPARAYEATLFGNAAGKVELAQALLIHGQGDLVFRLVQEQRLPTVEVYAGAIKALVAAKSARQVATMLKQARPTLDDEDWEEIVMTTVREFAERAGDIRTAETYVAKLTAVHSKVRAYVMCRQFKSAYLLAARTNDMDAMRLIHERSTKYDDKSTAEMSRKFIEHHSS